MAWLRIEVQCDPAEPGRDIATAWLAEAGCSMFEHEGEALHAFVQEAEFDRAEGEQIQTRMRALGLITWRISEVEEENWNARWESDYPEVEVGRAVRVSAPFHHRIGPDGFAHQITIQPRMAFGTGHHETTRGLLATMADMEWDGLAVQDMGCGSGVLGIYAAMRGATDVLLVDIDPWSIRNTRENLGLNGLGEGEAIEVREGGAQVLTDRDAGRFDVVIANINRNILLEDMAAYVATMKDSATLMLSGFMAPDVEPLVDAGRALGMKHSGLMQEGEWRVLSLRK